MPIRLNELMENARQPINTVKDRIERFSELVGDYKFLLLLNSISNSVFNFISKMAYYEEKDNDECMKGWREECEEIISKMSYHEVKDFDNYMKKYMIWWKEECEEFIKTISYDYSEMISELINFYVLADYAYVADGGSGLQIIDVSNQVSPLPMANICIPGASNGIYINNDYLYIASGYDGLHILPVPCFSLAQVKEVNPEGTEIKAMIPSGLVRGSYIIRVIDIDGEADWISNGFEVSGLNPFIRVLYPNGNEILRGTQQIKWWAYEDCNILDEITIDLDYSPYHCQTEDCHLYAQLSS